MEPGGFGKQRYCASPLGSKLYTMHLVPVSGLGFRISFFGFRVSDFRFHFLGVGFRVSGFEFRVSGLGFWFSVSGFGFRDSLFWVCGFGFRVSSFGFLVSGFGSRVPGFEFHFWGVGGRIRNQECLEGRKLFPVSWERRLFWPVELVPAWRLKGLVFFYPRAVNDQLLCIYNLSFITNQQLLIVNHVIVQRSWVWGMGIGVCANVPLTETFGRPDEFIRKALVQLELLQCLHESVRVRVCESV